MQALAAGGAFGAFGHLPAWSQETLVAARTGTPPELRGPNFDLTLAETTVNFDGRTGIATTINGRVGDSAQKSDPSVKTQIAKTKIRLAPKWSANHPDAGMTRAVVSM